MLNISIFIYIIGTKWCGPGNTAQSYNDLGDHRDVDKCCRNHDHCDNIPAGESKNQLTNDDYFTRLHCDCDKEFYYCLHGINSTVANRMGKLYFTLRKKCYQDEHPIVECVEYDVTMFVRRCVRYMLDESLPRLFQWFDLPLYNGPQINDRTIEDNEVIWKYQDLNDFDA